MKLPTSKVSDHSMGESLSQSAHQVFKLGCGIDYSGRDLRALSPPFARTGSERASRFPLCVFWSLDTIFLLLVFILIPSVLLDNAGSYSLGILKG